PASAAPVLSGTTVSAAASNNIVDVRWRRGGIIGGLAAGALAGAVIGAATYPGYYYCPGYGYSAYGAYPGGYYGYPGVSAYSSYAYPYQTCGVDAGYGRWDYSQC